MENITQEIAIIQPDQLEKVVVNSGIAIQEGEEIKQSYLPFLSQLAETQSQATKINFKNPSQIDETIARELRLKTVKIRTGAEKIKESRKQTYLLKGNLEQAAYNLIAASCKLTEATFENVEKAREIAEKKRQIELRKEREEKLSPYTENVVIYPLGLMSEDEFSALYVSLRSAHESRLEAEKKAEADRIAKEKKDAEEREAQRLENIRLKEEAAERERLAEIELKKQAKILADQKAKADKECAALLEKAEAERKERERLEAEIKAKNEAIEKAQKEAAAKLETERKAKEAQEKKAGLAPDKDKLKSLAATIKTIQLPEVKNLEAQAVIADVQSLLNKVVNFINEKAEKL
jgi:hypothetical protein